ncbi:uncharacterized protein LOC112555705 [Pomacea canaliculata]|uniref:uncharacterized protein LOC112555705 n=1 Tax=Pomacea canaliculata TaxID=400727 RepID=UPI000D735291|nr:uncharacterized protein LOC112555705 [Pomacea canaliculata]XP_025079987.1 uncharacterized protein LOC112555705 [Pomacea canaliculata]XP_025079988.1 uncharacterized protein LOC112555705 [Pomacea canaliculata]
MEGNHRETGRPHAVNGFSDDSMTQKESLPDPNSFTDPYYLHAILGENERSQDPPIVGRDSQNSHTSYSEVIDSLKEEWILQPRQFNGRTDPLPPIPGPGGNVVGEVRPKNKCTRPLIVLIVIFILFIVIAAVVLGVTLPIVLKGGTSSPITRDVCGNYTHPYYPAFDIYPHNCGKYIYCVNGSEGEVKQCADGLEYAFNMTSDPAKVCAAPSELTYCERLRIAAVPTVTLDLASYVAAFLNTDVELECIVRNVTTVSQVTFLHDDTIVASFNLSHRTVATMRTGASVVGQEVEGGYNVTLILTNVTCDDAGRYWCLANDSRGNVEKWTTVSIMESSVLPTLEIPRLVEGRQNNPPVCKVASMGHYSVSSFSWFLNSSSVAVRIPTDKHLDSVCYEGANC